MSECVSADSISPSHAFGFSLDCSIGGWQVSPIPSHSDLDRLLKPIYFFLLRPVLLRQRMGAAFEQVRYIARRHVRLYGHRHLGFRHQRPSDKGFHVETTWRMVFGRKLTESTALCGRHLARLYSEGYHAALRWPSTCSSGARHDMCTGRSCCHLPVSGLQYGPGGVRSRAPIPSDSRLSIPRLP